MRAVNLLPQKHRPHQSNGKGANSSYVVLGILALALLAAVGYVMQSNKITEGKGDIATAQQKTAEARARTQQLGPFGNFAAIKEQRVASVRQLADTRVDWERSVREIAHLLPEGVWLRDFDAGVTTAPTGNVAPGAAESTSTGPSIKLHGCAQKQPQVAVMLVRLRAMNGVHDVKLSDSTRGTDPDEAQGAKDTEGCGTHNLRANYEFNAVVELDAPKPVPTDKAANTPVRLGGGS